MLNWKLLPLILLLPGCGILKSWENQKSDVVITHTCTVEIAEAAAVKGAGDSDDMLHIISHPDCRVEVSTEMLEGDHVINIEEQRSRGKPMAIPVPEAAVYERKTVEERTETVPATDPATVERN